MSIDTSVIVKEVSTDLARKLKEENETVSTNTLNIIVKTVVREVIQKREYPDTMSEEAILDDLDKFYATILRISEYDYNMIGAEGESQHAENGVSRQYVDRDKYFSDVFKFVKFL